MWRGNPPSLHELKYVQISLAESKQTIAQFGLEDEHLIFNIPMHSLPTDARMFSAVNYVGITPQYIKEEMYGPEFMKEYYFLNKKQWMKVH